METLHAVDSQRRFGLLCGRTWGRESGSNIHLTHCAITAPDWNRMAWRKFKPCKQCSKVINRAKAEGRV